MALAGVVAAGGLVLMRAGDAPTPQPSPTTLAVLPTAKSTMQPDPTAAETPAAAPTATPLPTAIPTPSSAGSSAAPQYPGMSVGFVQSANYSGWRGANTKSMVKAAAESGVVLKVTYAENDFNNQLRLVQDFIDDQSINVIVIAPVGSYGWDGILTAAKKARKVVVIEDRPISSDASLYATLVANDLRAEGSMAAQAMCNLLRKSKAKNVLEVAGHPEAAATIDRDSGFRSAMTACGMKIVKTIRTDWDPTKAEQLTAAYLKTNKNIQGIFGHNDDIAIGAIPAIEAAGLKAGVDVQIVGVDATANSFQSLMLGKLGADVECNPNMGPQVLRAAWNALHGVQNPSFIAPDDQVFYASQGADELRRILAGRDY